MILVEFECERCGAMLKVRPMLAGKSVQCAKCRRKTAVPAVDDVTPSAASPVQAPPQPSSPIQTSVPMTEATPPPPPEPTAAPEPPPPVTASPHPTPVSPPLAQASVTTEAQQQQLAALNTEIKMLREKVAKADRASETAREELDRMQAQTHELKAAAAAAASNTSTAAELSAVQNRVKELEARLATSQEQLRLAREAIAKGAALPSEAVSFDENYEAEALLADLKAVPFGKILRTAVIIHVVIILGTSLGYLYRRYQMSKPAPTDPSITAEQVVPQIATPQPAQDVSPFENEPEVTPAPAPPPQETRPLSDIERRIQELPRPGEQPESDVSLGL